MTAARLTARGRKKVFIVGERLRAAVAETVADGADVDAELRHLITALGGSAFAG